MANRVNGAGHRERHACDQPAVVPGLPAKYFVRDIREIRFTNEEVPPVIGPFIDDGHDYTNRPNVARRRTWGALANPWSFPAGPTTSTSASSPWSSRSITASIGRATIWATPRPTAGRPDLRLTPGGLWRLPDEGALGERGRRRVPYRRRAHLRGVVRRELR
ncbi:MAG: hypothetical protein ACLTDR_15000 [Adlercreutzia equolifaciens]